MAARTAEGMKLVRAALCIQLDKLEAGIAARGPVGAEAQAAGIAVIAAEYGLVPVQRLAEGLAVALGAGGRGAAIGPWIERLRDSLACEAGAGESGNEQAEASWLASVMVRFAG